MARFSVDKEDDYAGPSNNPWSKKQRTTTTFTRSPPAPAPAPAQEQPHHRPSLEPQLVEDYDDDDEEVESEYEDEEEDEQVDGESENDEEEDGESEYDNEEDGEEDEEDGDEEEEEDQNEVGHPSNGVARNDDRERNSVSVILTDPDVLDCPICFDHLSIPVYQCENGHLVCSSCCSKLGSKCPSCAWPIYYHRCRGIEKVIESVKISCQNMEYGCKETVSYSKKRDHEGMCIYAPCLCPLPDCQYVGSSKPLSMHVSNSHPNSVSQFWYNCLFHIYLEKHQKYLILQEQSEGIIFILNNWIEPFGNVVNVSCIVPSSSNTGFSYDLIATNEDSSVRLQSLTECIHERAKHPPLKKFLVVPSDFVSAAGQLKLRLCIWRYHVFPHI
ncbi:hypothetical protein CsSME_00003438 [Camellia sinensis var. sinensis]